MKSFRGPVDGDIALYLQGWNDGMRGRPVKYRSTVLQDANFITKFREFLCENLHFLEFCDCVHFGYLR